MIYYTIMALSSPKYRDLYRIIKHDEEIKQFFNTVEMMPEKGRDEKIIYSNSNHFSVYTRWKRPTGKWLHNTLDILLLYHEHKVEPKIYSTLQELFPKDISNEISKYITVKHYLEFHNSYYDAHYTTRLKDFLGEMFIESHDRFVRVYGQGLHANEFRKWINAS